MTSFLFQTRIKKGSLNMSLLKVQYDFSTETLSYCSLKILKKLDKKKLCKYYSFLLDFYIFTNYFLQTNKLYTCLKKPF